MILDILIGLIIILAMVLGYRAGFVWTFFHTLGWLISMILAFIWMPRMRSFLFSETGLYHFLQNNLGERLSDMISITNISANFPRMLRERIDNLANQTLDAANTFLIDIVFTVISFLAVFFGIKLIFFVITLLLSKRYSGGVSGVLDGISGLIFGFIKGVFLVFALLTIMIPALSIFDSGLTDTVGGWLDSSYFAGTLYDNNFLILIIRDFMT